MWLIFSQGETGWGIFLLVWGALVVSSVDNVLKPMIISRGSDLPFMLVLLGVFGGVLPSASSACSWGRCCWPWASRW